MKRTLTDRLSMMDIIDVITVAGVAEAGRRFDMKGLG